MFTKRRSRREKRRAGAGRLRFPPRKASIAYIDPGNFATNIQGGAQSGYTLLWVVVASNLMAMLIQALSAKLGIATGHNLAELCREHFPRPVVWVMWLLMELVAMATDLAEFLGAAVGFNLLFGLPLWVAGILTAVATFFILGLENKGFRPVEAVITALLGVIAACYVAETFLDRPDWALVAFHAVVRTGTGAPLAGRHPVTDHPGAVAPWILPDSDQLRDNYRRALAASRARRAAVRFRAAASDAFLARAIRSCGVMVLRLRLPPLEPISAIIRRIRSGDAFLPIQSNDSTLPFRCRMLEKILGLGIDTPKRLGAY